jgi:nicotinamidase-related amidase
MTAVPDTALLIMDYQVSVVDRFGDAGESLLAVIDRAAAAARSAGLTSGSPSVPVLPR